MGLVVQMPEGERWTQEQDAVLKRLGATFKAIPVQTPPTADSPVDALFVRDGIIVSVAEIKCRQFSLEKLREHGSGLVTAKKLHEGIKLGATLCVPYFVFFALTDGTIASWHISDKHGFKKFAWHESHTPTRMTSVTDATVSRLNAFLPVEHMKVYRAHQ